VPNAEKHYLHKLMLITGHPPVKSFAWNADMMISWLFFHQHVMKKFTMEPEIPIVVNF